MHEYIGWPVMDLFYLKFESDEERKLRPLSRFHSCRHPQEWICVREILHKPKETCLDPKSISSKADSMHTVIWVERQSSSKRDKGTDVQKDYTTQRRVRQTKGDRSHIEIFRQKIKGKNPTKQWTENRQAIKCPQGEKTWITTPNKTAKKSETK